MQNVTTPLNDTGVLPKHQRVFLDDWTTDDISELQYGMIKSAIDDVRDGRKSKKMQQEARDWLLSEDSALPLSFSNCCLALGLDADVLLDLVNKLTQGGLYL